MFYFLSGLRDTFSGLNLFRYITFRAGMAAVTTFLLCVIFGPFFIRILKKMKFQEITKRDDCPILDQFQGGKQGTPTMGGIFVVGSIAVSILLWNDLANPYVLMTLFTLLSLACLGFYDDYIKLTKKGQRGLKKRSKLFWQIVIGAVMGLFVYYNPNTSSDLTFPFFKNLVWNLGIFYIPVVAIILIGTSNAVNLTDGLDGLAIGCVLIVSLTLAILCYITGHVRFSEYLFIPYVASVGELSIICMAILGASLGFLWFNAHPASVFMGDTGSLSLGGTLGIISVIIKKELLLVVLGGVFVVEALSVILQVFSVKVRGKRIFKVSPLHHHLQLSGWEESKIIIRFWIIAIILALLTLTTLKIR
ncbi:MAG: phospho-N-acetylmuramoyl-pentapeptide-transferase [Candidatus Omnitrophica bacterium]|nr:phospho-N-acetylmuramoyl-pentapeptide-transferase [Candidatus Omnitrophota bacterium]MCB9747799.1 phospho-N-acetylmuramoyl-pentapeptide-transferase [Candidatus Omnitrophota bacterium]